MEKINLNEVVKSKRVNPIDDLDSETKATFEKLKSSKGAEEAYKWLHEKIKEEN